MSRHFVANYHQNFFFPWVERGRVHPMYTYVKRSLPHRVIRRLMGKREFNYDFAPWYEALERGEMVVIQDRAIKNDQSLHRLYKYRDQIRIFTWDTLESAQDLAVRFKDRFEVYTHDRSDHRRYGLAFQTTFFQPAPNLTPHPQRYDLVFLGATKNRLPLIEQCYLNLKDQINAMFYVRAPQSLSQDATPVPLQRDLLDYGPYLQYVMSSRGILEILQPGQDSLTLRVMESLFYQKKLITTYQNIVHEDFYNPQNIMVIQGPDDLKSSKVRDFLYSDYVPVDPQLVDRYRFDQWIKRF
jgi:hypothetical protein